MNLPAILLFVCFNLSVAHPAFQHHFHKIVNSNECVKNCMKILHDSELEISILKNANISGFLLDLDTICRTIQNASDCMSECVHDSNNPFAMSSTVQICSQEARKDVELLQKCLIDKGSLITNTCIDECGDYKKANDKVNEMTMAMTSNPHDADKAAEVLENTDKACEILKCSSRCSRVLKATRRDLERHDLVETMAHNVPAECNYMYMPETMFNETKDELSQLVIENLNRVKQGTAGKSTTEIPDQIHLLRHHVHQDISYSLSQLQNKLLQKQFFVLEEQQRNLEKEAQKLDLELSLLKKKKEAQDVKSLP